MRRFNALVLRELTAYFNSPIAYVVLTAFLSLSGFFFAGYMFSYSNNGVPARYFDTMYGMSLIIILVAPFITMRLIAEEKNRGTIETLLTSPVSECAIVLSKFVSAMVFVLYLLVPTVIHLAVLAKYANVDWSACLVGYLGLTLLAAAVVSIGLFISSLCTSQIAAGIITFVVAFILVSIEFGAGFIRQEDNVWRQVLLRISFPNNTFPFLTGILDSRPTIYFLSFVALFLFATVKVMGSRRWLHRSVVVPIFLASLALLTANLVVVNMTSHKYFVRKDMTTMKRYELEPRTVNLLKRLDQDVFIYATPMTQGGPYFRDESLPTVWEETSRLIEEMKKYSDRLKYQVLTNNDVDDITKVQQAFQEVGTNMLYLMTGSGQQRQTKKLHIKEVYRGDEQTGRMFQFSAEQKLWQSIYTMLHRQRITIYVTTGHGELSMDDPQPQSILAMRKILEGSENAQFRPIDLFRTARVPNDCDLLMILSPQEKFRREELDVLREYLERGGRLFMTVYPVREVNLDKVMDEWGIVLDKRPLQSREMPGTGLILVSDFRSHAVNPAGWKGRRIPFPAPCVVGTLEKPPEGVQIQSLMFAGPETLAQQGEPGKQLVLSPGPHPVAAAASSEPKPGKKQTRIIVWGSALAISNLARNLGNDIPDYFMNTFKWLTEREEEIVGPPPKKLEEEPLRLTDSDATIIRIIAWGVLPMLGILLGVTTWVFRRK